MPFKNTRLMFLMVAALLSFSGIAFAQTGGTIRGTVISDINNAPVSGVSVRITQLRRNVETDQNGAYEFTGVPDGNYTLITHIEGFSDRAQSVRVAGGAATADFRISLAALTEEVTVTASGSEESIFEAFQSVTAVGSSRIREQASTSVGEILEREAGVGKRSFGPGSSRPTIRGFESDRVLILQDGIRNGSLGFQSGDHGEPVDALNLERLEVIKGPATLLYGSNAIGGVVNAVTGDENDAHPGIRGSFSALGATNNRQGGVSGNVEYGYEKFLMNGAVSLLREGDFRTPLGQIPNSASRATGGNFGVGYFSDKYFIRGGIVLDRRRYGVPYAPLFEEGAFLTGDCEEEPKVGKGEPCQYDIFDIRDEFANSLPEVPDEQIDIKMRRNNFRFRGGFRDVQGPIAQGNFSIDFTDYQHSEIETEDGIDEIATTFDNDVFSFRAAFKQAKYKNLTGQFGFEGFRRSYLTVGAESLIDGRVRHNNFAAFALQEFSFDRVALQFGGRVENNQYNPVNTDLLGRDFTGFSGAAGVRFRLWEGAAFITNFSTSFRAPGLEEIYNLGPHIGTVTFEIGDLNLTRERSNGIELSLRQNFNRVRLNGSFYYYDIDNFVFLAPQDENDDGLVDVEDGLPVGAFFQSDSRFTGLDLNADFDITNYLGAFVRADIVSARLKEFDTAVPRIPPARLRLGLDLRYKGLSVRPEVLFASKKDFDNTFELETPTAGYRLFNINASYVYAKETYAHIFTVGGTNLGDKLYRNHSNFIKDILPDQGRGLKASYTIRFF
ncbi:TonB-dependent receptor [soil metagenome]